MRKTSGTLLPIILLLAASSCDQQQPLDTLSTPTVSASTVEMPVRADWLGHKLGLSPPKLRPVGKATNISTETTHPPLGPEPIDNGAESTAPNKMMAMGPDNMIYEVLVPVEDLRKLGAYMVTNNLNGASENRAAANVEKGWSNGKDNRIVWPNTTTDWPRDTIGNISSGCTGTLFWYNLAITAFHCLWDGNGNWIGARFAAGTDGAGFPYGDIDHQWKYWDQGFIDNNCHKWLTTGYRTVCKKYDWAVLVLASDPIDATGTTPGFQGYFYHPTDSVVSGWTKYHYGYPQCSLPDSPAMCQADRLYGQTGSCTTGTFTNSLNGFKRNFTNGCDVSPGHSGGPLYSWSPGPNGPYVVATQVSDSCAGSACTSANPNNAFRIDQWLGDQMGYWRTIW